MKCAQLVRPLVNRADNPKMQIGIYKTFSIDMYHGLVYSVRVCDGDESVCILSFPNPTTQCHFRV